LSFFLQPIKDKALVSPQIHFVMFQFLFTTVKPFTSEFLTKSVLELIFKKVAVKETRRLDNKSPPVYLYQNGKASNSFLLILSGEATLEVGKEKLEFPAGPFAYFGVNALLSGCETADQILNEDSHNKKAYIPDFSLRVDDRCVYMKIERDLWKNGLVKSRFEMNKQRENSHRESNENESRTELSKNEETANSVNKQSDAYSQPSKYTIGKRSNVAFNVLERVQQSVAKNKEETGINQADAKAGTGKVTESTIPSTAEQEPLLNSTNN
jgi:hypothetical protein